MAIDTKLARVCIHNGIKNTDELLLLCDEIDRLRAESKPTQQQEGKTVEVRFPAKVDGKGEVIINQYHRDNKGVEHHSVSSWTGAVTVWLTATLPVPEEREVEATVTTATTGGNETSGGKG